MFLVLNFLRKFWRFDDPLSQKWFHKSGLMNLALEVLGNRAKGELNTTREVQCMKNLGANIFA